MKIKSTHSTLAAAINAAGGLNRAFNPSTFDKEITTVQAAAIEGAKFLVVDHLGSDAVLYAYQADVKLLNEFSPFGSGISNRDLQVVTFDGETLKELCALPNDQQSRKMIAKTQRVNSHVFVLNV